MRTISHISVIAAIAVGLAAAPMAASAQTTQKFTANKLNEYGLVYSLPATLFDITLEISGTIETPGEFYQYARLYLNADPIMAPSQSWTLKSATIVPVGVADTEEQYLVQFKSGAATYMVLTEDGVPLAVNSADYPLTPAVALPEGRDFEPTVLESPDAAYAFTPDMLAGTSVAKRAELAAAKIYEIRETRNEIIAGQSENMPTDGSAMQIALDNLARQEAVLTALFLGTRQTATRVATFRFTPGADDERTILTRISALNGFVAPTDLQGAPVYVNLKVEERGALPVNEKGEAKEFPKGGLAYRIPGKAGISVSYDGRTYASGTYSVGQLGVVFGLDPKLFTDKKAPAYLYFDPITGAVREIGTLSVAPAN